MTIAIAIDAAAAAFTLAAVVALVLWAIATQHRDHLVIAQPAPSRERTTRAPVTHTELARSRRATADVQLATMHPRRS